MPIPGIAARREYHRQWHANRRAAWFAENGPCAKCGSWERLELDHIDRATKVDHHIWSWSEKRRAAELAKCQVLCRSCHIDKTREENRSKAPCGTRARYKAGCRCAPCKAANAEYSRELKARQVPAAVGKPFTAETRRMLDLARWSGL